MKPLDQFLYWYTLVASSLLILSSLTRIQSSSQLLSLALMLPIPLYVILQGIKRLHLYRQSLRLPSALPHHLSFSATFLQNDPYLKTTLVLVGISIVVVLLRLL